MATTIDEFTRLMAEVTGKISGRRLDPGLGDDLDRLVPPDGPLFKAIEAACREAVAAGWMCGREAAGIAYGRVLKPGPGTAGMSVDVVRMKNLKGPHHIHPQGEIDMIMPLDPGATFDGHGRGWCVYGPGSAHHPTVGGGEALVLYLLPDGEIEFTGK